MKTKILISFLILLACVSCIKKEQKVTDEAQVIQLLNNSEADSAMDKVESLLAQDPENENLLYLKASVLSMQAGVDVYKLFPLLKAKIFDVAISQWSEQREFEKRMQDRRKTGDSTDPKLPREYKPLVDEKISYEIVSIWGAVSPYYSYLSVAFRTPDVKVADWDFLSFNEDIEENSELWNLMKVVGVNQNAKWMEKIVVEPEFRKLMIKHIKIYHYRMWEEKIKKVNKKQNQVKGIQALWSVTDMIPVIKQIPKIEPAVLDKLQTAQKILMKIVDKNKVEKNEIYNKSRKQLMMISALKIIGRFQAAFNLEDINSPNDLTCSSNEKTGAFVVDSLPDALLLINGIDDDKFKEKNDKALVEAEEILNKVKKEMDENPAYRDELIQNIQKDIEKMKTEDCFGENN